MKLKRWGAENDSLEAIPHVSRCVAQLLCQAVALFLILVLQGCSDGKAPRSTEETTNQATDKFVPKHEDYAAIKAQAEQGIMEAQHKLGVRYLKGDGVATNMVEAANWWRKAAEQGYAKSQNNLGICYAKGQGVEKDMAKAVAWWRKAADQDDMKSQAILGSCYMKGEGVTKNPVEAAKWWQKGAERGYERSQYFLATCYANGDGVTMNIIEAVKWYRKAAEQGNAKSQFALGLAYYTGAGATKDYVEAHLWFNLASAQNIEAAKAKLLVAEQGMTRPQIAEAQRLARNFKPRKPPDADEFASLENIIDSRPVGSGTGFFIAADGFLVTNEHVVRDAAQVRLVTSAGFISAKVVKVDTANDLALLKAEGKFSSLPVTASRGVKLGGTVVTVGFPNIGLQGFAPKLAKGEIASLSGGGDDARYFQISVPVQPGNSGGALVDERGNVVGVVSAKLDAAMAFKSSGVLPENVNYAVKSSFLLSFLESVPGLSAKLKEPMAKERKFDEVVKAVEEAAVLVLVY